MTDRERPPEPARSDNATENGVAISTRARIDQIRARINQLQEEKELELLILQLHDLEQELAQLRSRRRSLPNYAARYRTRSPDQRRSPLRQTRSRSPYRAAAAVRAGPSSSSNPGALAPVPAPTAAAPVTTEVAVSSSSPAFESPGASGSDSHSPPVKSEPAEANSAEDHSRHEASDANPNPNTNPGPGLENIRPPAEWCQRCLRCMEKEPTLRCVVSPRSPRGKCIRCCNTHGCCEPIPAQCARFAHDAVAAALAFCADRSSARFDRLINAVSAVRVEMRKYPTPATPKGPGGRLPAPAPPSSAPAPAPGPVIPSTPTPAAPAAARVAPAST